MSIRSLLLRTVACLVCLLSWALSGCGVPGANGPADTFGLDLAGVPAAAEPSVIVFFIDGVNAATFDEMFTAGELPAIREFFGDGLYSPRAVANVPSITLVNQTSVVTGQFPGHHGITSNNWFDRNRLIYRNYMTIAQKNALDGDYTAPTIFELLDDRTTVSLFLQAHRGSTKFVENQLSAVLPYLFGWHEFTDRLALYRFDLWADIARTRQEFPAVTFVYQLAVDFAGYDHGQSSPEYRAALRHVDKQIGRVLGDFRRAGLLENVTVALVSDHGLIDVTDHFNLDRFLRDTVGLDVARAKLWEETPFENRLNVYQRHTAVVYGAGDRHRAICLRRPTDGGFAPWLRRPTADDLRAYPTPTGPADLPALLVAETAVEAVAHAAGPNRARLVLNGGEVEFRQSAGRGGPVSYHLITGDDPLGYEAAAPALTDGRPHEPAVWLAATARTDFPGLPDRLIAYFRAQRAGDLAVFAAAGWDFGASLRAGHGGLRAGDMLTPLLIAGPGVPNGTLETAQTVDLLPTLLTLMGREAPSGIDGASLIPATAPAVTD